MKLWFIDSVFRILMMPKFRVKMTQHRIWHLILPSIPVYLVSVFNVGTQALNPRDISWLASDNFTSYIAQVYYLSQPWHFPLGANDNYGLENATSLTYTGPNLFLLIPHKILDIDSSFQFFGFWILINVYLQVYVGMKIAARFSESVLVAFSFGMLMISPFLINRMQMHLWLISHFLILWAILILIKYHQNHEIDYWQVSGLIVCSYLINTYLLAMVGTILFPWVVYILFLQRRKFSEILRLAVHILTPVTFCLLIVDGAFIRIAPYESARSLLTPTYGAHPANLLTLLQGDTGIPANLNAGWGDVPQQYSYFKLPFGHIEGDYEGFTYLGLGLLTLVAIGLVLTIRENNIKKMYFKFWPYFLTGIGVWLFAISYRIGFGSFELRIPFPLYGKYALSLFRTSGRFMWVLAYLLVILAFVGLARYLGKRKLTVLLIITLLIQVMDLALPAVSRYAYLHDFKESPYIANREESTKFALISKGIETVRYWPQQNAPTGWGYISLLAEKNDLATDGVYTSRPNFIEMRRVEAATKEHLCSNSLESRTAYIIPTNEIKILRECGMTLVPKMVFREVSIFANSS